MFFDSSKTSNFDSSVVVHELQLAINRALSVFCAVEVANRMKEPLLVLINTYSKPSGSMKIWFFMKDFSFSEVCS